jgi:hypothetical protein
MRFRGRATVLALVAGLVSAALPTPVQGATPAVLLVGPAGTPGAQFTSIQAAVDAAHQGDWVLVAPGVYHEKGSRNPANPAGVLITRPNIHLRGMNRNTVIVDGTRFSPLAAKGTAPAGSPACSSAASAQDLGPVVNGHPTGYNGIEVRGSMVVNGNLVGHLADGVSIENLSVCNYLTGSSGAGNEIWWNGGDGSGQIGMGALHGDYLTTTSTYFVTANGPAGQYGIFTSNEGGPALIDHSYASNMRDSGFYFGACRDCNLTMQNSRSSANSDGISLTNAGGRLVIRNDEVDHNRAGTTPNAQNNDDWPSPQLGQCPAAVDPLPGAVGCDYFIGNYFHDNNNPNVPGAGLTSVSAIGTAIELVATQHVTVTGNRIENQGSWGVISHDFPDPETGQANCQGGTPIPAVMPTACLWQSLGNRIDHNQFTNVGFFGATANADIANQAQNASTTANPSAPTDPNCFSLNTDTGGTVSQVPPSLQDTSIPNCNEQGSQATSGELTDALLCATGSAGLFAKGAPPDAFCPPQDKALYPTHDGVCGTSASPGVLTPAGDTTNGVWLLPARVSLRQTTMPNPCAGVPANAYCTIASPSPAVSPVVTGTGTALPPTSGGGLPLLPALLFAAAGALGLREVVRGRGSRQA